MCNDTEDMRSEAASEDTLTLEDKIRRGMFYGYHCKVVEDMLIDTVRKTTEKITYQMVSSMIKDDKFSLDEIAQISHMPIEKVQEIYQIEKENGESVTCSS